MEKNIFKIGLLLILLIIYTDCYSLEGTWTLNSSYLSTKLSKPITFDFYRQIQNNGSQLSYYLQISSCMRMKFKYRLVDNEIFIDFVQNIANLYECSSEINELRQKIQMIFYFYIIGNSLQMHGADKLVKLKLFKPEESIKLLTGQWTTIIVQDQPLYKSIISTQSQFKICNGNGIIQYTLTKLSEIKFKITQTKGCDENLLFTTFYKTSYYRWKGNMVYFYDNQYNQIMMINKVGINLDNNNNANTNTNNMNSNITSIKINNTNTNSNSNSSIIVSSSINNQSSTTVSSANKPEQVKQIQALSSNFLINNSPISPVQIYGKWLLSDPLYDFSSLGYFLIIQPSKIILYGGCNIYYTNYILTVNNMLENIKLQNTLNNCPQLNSNVKNMINNIIQWKKVYLNNATKKNIIIFNQQGKVIIKLDKI